MDVPEKVQLGSGLTPTKRSCAREMLHNKNNQDDEKMRAFRAFAHSRALALACLLFTAWTRRQSWCHGWCFRPGHSKHAAFLLLQVSHINHLSLPPLLFATLPRVQPPQKTRAEMALLVSLVRANAPLPLFFCVQRQS